MLSIILDKNKRSALVHFVCFYPSFSRYNVLKNIRKIALI